MKTINKIAEGVFSAQSSLPAKEVVSLIEIASRDYPLEIAERRPHLTMEFPIFFKKQDSLSSVKLRENLFVSMLPYISEYMETYNLNGMYPKKDFVTVSKLLPGLGMEAHRDNPSKKSNHFICMLYLNEEYDGGEICFPELNLLHKPKAGEVLLYKASLLHEVRPVTRGQRYSIGFGLTDGVSD